MSDLPLNLPRGHAPPGDSSGRILTPAPVARAIVARLAELFPPPRTLTEPSVGAGALARAAMEAWPNARVTGVDIDPTAEGLVLVHDPVVGDWPTEARRWESDDLNLGNPPYRTVGKGGLPGVPWSVTLGHLLASRRTARVSAQVLPLCYAGQDMFLEAMEPGLCWLWPLVPRPWPQVREVAVYVWVAAVGQLAAAPFAPHWMTWPLRWK